jgi:hypothetical protein
VIDSAVERVEGQFTSRVDRVVLLERELVPVLVSLSKAYSVGRLRTRNDNLFDSQFRTSLDDVIRRLRVGLERLVVGYQHVSGIRRQVDHCIGCSRRSRSRNAKVFHGKVRCQGVEDLTRIGQIDLEGVDGYAWVRELGEVEVEDGVALGDEVRDDMSSCFPASSGYNDSRHGVSVCLNYCFLAVSWRSDKAESDRR